MGLNVSLIQARFADIEESLQKLAKLSTLSKEEFLANADARDVAAYRLLVAIEATIQVCYHICAHVLKRAPGGYAECFKLLGEAGILPEELSSSLQRMARFRNVLVHRYWDVDYERVYDILHTRLEDFRQFQRAVSHLLEKRSSP